MNNAIDIIRFVVPSVAKFGGSGLVGLLAGHLIPRNSSKVMKLVYMVGAVGLGLAAGNVAEKAVSDVIEEGIDIFFPEEEKKEVEI